MAYPQSYNLGEIESGFEPRPMAPGPTLLTLHFVYLEKPHRVVERPNASELDRIIYSHTHLTKIR